jgi:hypothetical protein
MGNFNDFMFTKTLDRLAEKCVREKLPIVEFVNWYIEEGQHLSEAGFWGDVGKSALAGGGYGALAGSPFGMGGAGALGGAALGGIYGGIKNVANRFGRGNYNTTKQAALDALQKFAALSPRHKADIDQMINNLNAIQPDGGASTAAAPAAAAAGTPPPAPANNIKRGYIAAAMKDPLIKDLGSELIGNLAHNNIPIEQFMKVLKTYETKTSSGEEAVVKTLQELGIRNRAGGQYNWNPTKSAFEHTA